MSPQFESNNPRHSGAGAREWKRIDEAHWQTRGGHPTTESDVEADLSMSEIYNDKEYGEKKLFEEYKKVGFHLRGKDFIRMIEKWERDEKLTEDERDMREEVRNEFTTRMGIVKACDKLLTEDVFKGVADEDAPINRLVGELGSKWALSLIKPRLVNLVGEDDGTDSLTELWSALKDMHGVYQTKGFNKVYSRIERYRDKYNISPAKWAEIQRGGTWSGTADRAFQEFQKQHGFLGRIWHSIPHVWHSAWIGWAGWDEQHDSSMQRLRKTRERALAVLGNLMSPEFQEIVDKAIKSGEQEKSEELIKEADERENETAKGLSPELIEEHHNNEWTDYAAANPAENNTSGYDNWRKSIFQKGYSKHVKQQMKEKKREWVGKLADALFGVRLERIPRPAGI